MTRSKTRSTQSSLEHSVVTYARDSNKEKTCVCSSKLRPRSRFTLYLSQAFVSCLGCQQSISDWLGKLKPNKLLSGCQNELKGGGGAVEKATNPGRRFLFFSRLCRSFSRPSHANLAALPLVSPARQNCHATQATP